jgi:hypothetical protein
MAEPCGMVGKPLPASTQQEQGECTLQCLKVSTVFVKGCCKQLQTSNFANEKPSTIALGILSNQSTPVLGIAELIHTPLAIHKVQYACEVYCYAIHSYVSSEIMQLLRQQDMNTKAYNSLQYCDSNYVRLKPE